MNNVDIEIYAKRILGVDKFYEEYNALESDVNFFKLLMEREKKSKFRFDVRISYLGSYRAFDAIWKRYAYYVNNLKDAFAEFIVMENVFSELEKMSFSERSAANQYTDEQLKDFIKYFERYNEINLNNLVGDFIGCSLTTNEVLKIIDNLRK